VDKLDGPITFVSPDSGGVKRATRFASHIDAEVAFVYKRRRSDVRNEVNAEWVVGDVEGRHCVIVDDMIDTAGTAVASAELVPAGGRAPCWSALQRDHHHQHTAGHRRSVDTSQSHCVVDRTGCCRHHRGDLQ